MKDGLLFTVPKNREPPGSVRRLKEWRKIMSNSLYCGFLKKARQGRVSKLRICYLEKFWQTLRHRDCP